MPAQTIGQSIVRVDARGKVTGETLYSGDLSMPGMLFMKILFAERPHARVISIETSKAEASPGVIAVYTARDIPVNDYGLQIPDQPVLNLGKNIGRIVNLIGGSDVNHLGIRRHRLPEHLQPFQFVAQVARPAQVGQFLHVPHDQVRMEIRNSRVQNLGRNGEDTSQVRAIIPEIGRADAVAL